MVQGEGEGLGWQEKKRVYKARSGSGTSEIDSTEKRTAKGRLGPVSSFFMQAPGRREEDRKEKEKGGKREGGRSKWFR